MWQFAFLLFFVSVCIFAAIMLHDSRTLRSGASFLFMMMCLAVYCFLSYLNMQNGWQYMI